MGYGLVTTTSHKKKRLSSYNNNQIITNIFKTLTELLSDFDVVPCDKHIKNDVFLKKKLRTVYNKKRNEIIAWNIFIYDKNVIRNLVIEKYR